MLIHLRVGGERRDSRQVDSEYNQVWGPMMEAQIPSAALASGNLLRAFKFMYLDSADPCLQCIPHLGLLTGGAPCKTQRL